MNEFFDFNSKLLSSTVQARPLGLKNDKDGKSVYLKLIKGDYQGVDFPVIFKQEFGTRLTDILDTGYAGFFLISEKMKFILETSHLTGWKTFPIKLYNKKEDEIFGYYGFSVIGQSGPTHYEQSAIIEKKRMLGGPICNYYKGVKVYDWDGTDFFTPKGTYETFITKRAAEILKKNKITNVALESLEEKETAIRHVKIG